MNRRTFRLRLLACALAAAAGDALSAPPAAEDASSAIQAVFRDIADAYAARDLERILGHYSDYYLGDLRAMNKGRLRERLEVAFRGAEKIHVDFTVSDVSVVGEYASARVAEDRRTTDARTGEVRTDRTEWLCILERQDDAWRIAIAAPLRETTAPAGELRFPEQGFALTLPAGWAVFPVRARYQEPFTLLSDDRRALIEIAVSTLPLRLTPEQLAASHRKALAAVLPGCEVQRCEVEPAGQCQCVVTEATLPGFRSPVRMRASMLMADRDVIMLSLTALDPARWNDYLATFEALQRSVHRIEKRSPAPGRGVVAGTTYTHPKLGCQVVFPEGWRVTVGSNWQMHATAESPDGAASITFGAVSLDPQDIARLQPTAEPAPGEPESPEARFVLKLLDNDLDATRSLCDGYRLVSRETVRVAGHPAARSVSRFVLVEPRQRTRVYIWKQPVLFFLVADVSPADEAQRFAPLIDSTVRSIRLDAGAPSD